MVGIESDVFLILGCYLYREWLSVLVGQIYLLTYRKVLRAWELSDLHSENSVGISLTVSFLRHQVYINYLAYFHVCHSSIEASDHLACATDKFQWFSTVIRS